MFSKFIPAQRLGMRLLENMFSRFVQTGQLTIIDSAGQRHSFFWYPGARCDIAVS